MRKYFQLGAVFYYFVRVFKKKIRENPGARVTALLKKVFSQAGK